VSEPRRAATNVRFQMERLDTEDHTRQEIGKGIEGPVVSQQHARVEGVQKQQLTIF
jgi:hypothetical protein